MDLTKLKGNELLNQYRYGPMSIFKSIEDEILSRFNLLEELERQVENTKCCGNCYINCNCETFKKPGYAICDQWKSDQLTTEERKVK